MSLPPVLGVAASMACVILTGGARGKRYALPHSTMLLHQPSQGFEGYIQATDLEIRTREMVRVRERLEGILVHNTGQDRDRIHTDTDRDYYLTAQEAKDYGIIDSIVTPASAHVSGSEQDGEAVSR